MIKHKDGSDYGDVTCLKCGHKFVFYDWAIEEELIKKFKEIKDVINNT